MVKSLSIPVTESNQVGEARRAAQKMGTEIGLGETALGNLSIIVTELGSNLHKHAKQGELILRIARTGDKAGVEVLSLDRGPGIKEVAKCMEDGFSTSGTRGHGLGSIKRLSSVFDIYSSEQGTAIVSQTWKASSSETGPGLEIGAVCIPYPGEVACGDAWSSTREGASHTLLMADGLGHGKDAAEAADMAIDVFKESHDISPQILVQRLHGALRATRGAAILALKLSFQTRKIICSGVGNISSCVVTGATAKSFVSLNGTIGHQASRFQEFIYDWNEPSLIVMHSDGLLSKWKLDHYPGLQMRHASLVAGILYRDFRRGRDDVTVVVARGTSKSSI